MVMAGRRGRVGCGLWRAAVALLALAANPARAQPADAGPAFWIPLQALAALPNGAVSRRDVEGLFHVSMQPYVGQPNLPHTDRFIARPTAPGGFTLSAWSERPGVSLFGFQWGGGPNDPPAAFPQPPANACVTKAQVSTALAARGWSLVQTVAYPDLPAAEIYRKGPTGFLRAYYLGPNQCLGYVQIISGVQTRPVMPELAIVPRPDPAIHPALLQALQAFGQANGGLDQTHGPYAILLDAINHSPRLIGELNADFEEPASGHQVSGFGQNAGPSGVPIGIAEFNITTKRIMFSPGALGAGLAEGDLILAIGRAQDQARLPAEIDAAREAVHKRAPELLKPVNGSVDATAFIHASQMETRRVLILSMGRAMLVGWNDYVSSQPQGAPLTAIIANLDYAPLIVSSGGGQIGQ
jgi:hypothetical protein